MSLKDSFTTLKENLFHPYSISIRNEENLGEEGRLKFNIASVMGLGLLLLILLSSTIYFAATRLGNSEFRNTGLTIENRKILAQMVHKADSLSQELEAYSTYYENLDQILKEGQGIYRSGAKPGDSLGQPIDDSLLAELSAEELELRQAFESETGNDLLPIKQKGNPDISKILLFHPVEGIVSAQYDPSIDHFGVDIVGKKNEPVKAVADGTVLLASWTEDAGYVIALQHDYNLTSVYKHNSTLTHKVGDRVSGGEIIAIMGNSGGMTSGPHLHFELWQEGKPLNPAQYLSF